jgi:integrase
LEQLRQKVNQLASGDGGSVMFSEVAKRWLEVVGVGEKASTLDRYQRAALPKLPQADDKMFTIANPKHALDTACKKAKMPHFSNHSLRHFFVSNCIEAGADTRTAAFWYQEFTDTLERSIQQRWPNASFLMQLNA